MNKVSAVTAVYNAINGHMCLFENLVNMSTLMDEILIIDLSSDDGTYEKLLGIAETNLKFTILSSDKPNTLEEFETEMDNAISSARYERVIYFFANEVFPVGLIANIRKLFNDGYINMVFWEIEYKTNFQDIKELPKLVRRTGWREHLSLSSPTNGDVELVSDMKWDEWTELEVKKYWQDLIVKITPETAFVNQGYIENCNLNDPGWMTTKTRFNLPPVLRHHVGETKYKLYPQILRALVLDDVYNLSQEGLNV